MQCFGDYASPERRIVQRSGAQGCRPLSRRVVHDDVQILLTLHRNIWRTRAGPRTRELSIFVIRGVALLSTFLSIFKSITILTTRYLHCCKPIGIDGLFTIIAILIAIYLFRKKWLVLVDIHYFGALRIRCLDPLEGVHDMWKLLQLASSTSYRKKEVFGGVLYDSYGYPDQIMGSLYGLINVRNCSQRMNDL